MDYIVDLQKHIIDTSLKNGALLVGFTKIRRIEPVIILGFPFSDEWFLKNPIKITKQLGKDYKQSKNVQRKLNKILTKEDFYSQNKSVLSIYGDFRPLAVSANLGEWGRNGLVVNEKYGSNLLFAATFTNAPFDTQNNNNNLKHCNDCKKCISSCPNNAFENNRFHFLRCLPYALKGCSECLKNCSKN
ncbi:MAG: 4Fe-4S ferredoxin [Firmicutes bacterium]|nr:4Fe-4S ferredoxin [Bacillota bacterium]